MRVASLILALSVAAMVRTGAGQGTAGIAGKLLDRSSHQPVEGAAIALLGTPISLRSSVTGQFAGTGLRPGTYVLQARALGYAPASRVVELVASETLAVVFELEPVAITLPSVTVETQWRQRVMVEFEERRRQRRGVYITEEDIKRADATRLSDVLRSVSGVRLICRYSGCVARMARNECQPDFVVDGHSANNATSLELPTIGIIGIEIYRTITETPVEFIRGANTCGTIVIWTRTGP